MVGEGQTATPRASAFSRQSLTENGRKSSLKRYRDFAKWLPSPTQIIQQAVNLTHYGRQRARNIELSIYRVAKGEEIAGAIDIAKTSGAAALNVWASPMLDGSHRLIMDRLCACRPMYQWPERAEEGGFAAYGPRFVELPRLTQLAQLFSGVKPPDIPVEQPTKFELVINRRIAYPSSQRSLS
jgi:ABC-type uncharacterized transport system substrate-binding protein